MILSPMYLVFALPALLLAFYAQWKVKSTYKKYTRQANYRGISGGEAAYHVLRAEGLGNVSIEGTRGELSDHYDPRSKTLRLSQGIGNGRSIASLAVMAHEVGHALQDAHGYAPMRVRTNLVPAVTIGSWVGPLLFIVGYLFASPQLAWAGVAAFSGAAVFALVTLPVEFNASQRGLQLLTRYNLLDNREMAGARAMLNAAALTYVAALAQVLSTLLYYVFLLTGFNRRS